MQGVSAARIKIRRRFLAGSGWGIVGSLKFVWDRDFLRASLSGIQLSAPRAPCFLLGAAFLAVLVSIPMRREVCRND